MEERRKSKRMELELSLALKRLDSDENNESGEVEVEITNVSKSGVGFRCEETLTTGAVYEAYLTIWTKEVLHTFLQVVRIDPVGSAYEYGSLFIGMSETDAARIQVYQTVNNEQEI